MTSYPGPPYPPPPEPDPAKCPKCGRFGVSYDRVLKAWTCLMCRWRDRT
jgi:hypothetical protein